MRTPWSSVSQLDRQQESFSAVISRDGTQIAITGAATAQPSLSDLYNDSNPESRSKTKQTNKKQLQNCICKCSVEKEPLKKNQNTNANLEKYFL